MTRIFLLLGLLLAVMVAAFAWQNPGMVTVKLLRMEYQGTLALICMVLFALGFLSHFFFSLPSFFKHKWVIYKQKKKIKDLEDELADREKHPIFDYSTAEKTK